jgi:hypothetical protein
MAVKYSKWSYNIPTFYIPRPSPNTQIWGFGMKINHLATLAVNRDSIFIARLKLIHLLAFTSALENRTKPANKDILRQATDVNVLSIALLNRWTDLL